MTVELSPEEVLPHDLVRVVTETRIPSGWPYETANVIPKVQLLHRPKPKPPVGTILTGKQVKSRQWKRGTKFCLTRNSTLAKNSCRASQLYSITQLETDGTFSVLEDGRRYPNSIIGDDAEFILVYRPEEESDHREEA